MLSIRLVTGEESCAIAVCFDHALCDVSGVSLLLAHVISRYYGTTSSVLPSPDINGRDQQARIIALAQNDNADAGSNSSADSSGGADSNGRGTHQKKPTPKGGCGCVEFSYSAELLRKMKASSAAHSRHDAVFTDVLLLLREVKRAEESSEEGIHSATISRDDRARAGLSAEHFGNGIVAVHAELPPGEDSKVVAAALREAIKEGFGQAGEQQSTGTGQYADVHLNTWWHPLQRIQSQLPSLQGFSIGPSSLAAAGQMCMSRGGQPGVTVLPAANGGLFVTLLAPLSIAQGLLKVPLTVKPLTVMTV
jgi:hypothetical protein